MPKLRTVLVHGFLGSASDWDALRAVSPDFADAVAIDLLADLDAADTLERAGRMLNAAIRKRQNRPDEKFTLVGYSLGGRVAMHALLADPTLWAAAVWTSAHPGLDDREARASRLEQDANWSARFARTESEEPGGQLLTEWQGQPVFAGRKSELSQTASLRQRTIWARILRQWSLAGQPNLSASLAEIGVPQLWIAGAEDLKFSGIAQAQADCWIAPQSAHRVPWESPAAWTTQVLDFITRAADFPHAQFRPKESPKMENTANDSLNQDWTQIKSYQDIKFERTHDGIAKITINRPEVRNAFRPTTVMELQDAFLIARNDPKVGVVVLTGEGPLAFCSGGDQRVRGDGGYVGEDGIPRLNVLDLQKQIRSLPKPVIAMVAGYAVGGGHVLHLVCDLTIAADNARFGQTGPKVGSFDGGLGSSYLARVVGQKKAREIWFLCRQYSAQEALDMGLVNTVVPLAELENETLKWCREILNHSPIALRCLKSALNADCDGQMGLLDLAGNATLLYYMSEEAKEGKNAYLEKRQPDFAQFDRLP